MLDLPLEEIAGLCRRVNMVPKKGLKALKRDDVWASARLLYAA